MNEYLGYEPSYSGECNLINPKTAIYTFSCTCYNSQPTFQLVFIRGYTHEN
ncbi:MAG: hypothetical protein HQ510_00520 [Candidatus Marinimicrobia bacterium]|nr:hypothetical protein [Candidatus Neomarinimicrobiota bacterium]